MEKEPFDLKKEILEFLKLLVFWGVIFFLLTKFIINPVQVIGSSMYPTLKDRDRGFSSIISTHFELNRFDIVVVEAKDQSNDHWVKRIIGMPNETIECKNGVIYINHEPIQEDFLDTDYVLSEIDKYGFFTEDFDEIQLKENEYFLMGDNRIHSTDSRRVGPFTKDEITSVGIFVYYPFDELGMK